MSASLRSSVVILALMGLSALALLHFVDVALEDEPGIRMDLPEECAGRAGRILRYCHARDCRKQFFSDELGVEQGLCPSCAAPLFHMSFEEWEQLPKDTTFLKARYDAEDALPMFVTIVLSGRDRESIHRPERCLVGQGLTITRRTVVPAPLPDGRSIQLMALEYQVNYAAEGGAETFFGYYAYWFVGVGRETHSHWTRMFWLAWDRVVNSVAHKWAYISISGTRNPVSSDYQDEIRRFVTGLHEHIVL